MGIAVISANTTLKNQKKYTTVSTGTGSVNVTLATTSAGEYLEISSIGNVAGGVFLAPQALTLSVIDDSSNQTLFSLSGNNGQTTSWYNRIVQEMQGTTAQPKLFNVPPNCTLKITGSGIVTAVTVALTGRSIINTP